MVLRKIEERPLLFTLFLFLLNLLLKSIFLTRQEIGLDEPFSIYHAQFDPGTIIEQLKGYNNPPLYELLLHFWIQLFGLSPLAVRTLPLLFACLGPVALFYFGKRFYSSKDGIVSSLLLSFSSLLTFYAHDSRVYSLFLLLSILCMHVFLDMVANKRSGIKTAALYILLSSLLIYSHYFGIFILLIQSLYLVLHHRKWILKFLGYISLILIAYTPQLMVLYQRTTYSVSNGTWLLPPNGAESLYNMIWSFSNVPLITVLALALLGLSSLKAVRDKGLIPSDPGATLLVVWFLFAWLGMFLVSYKVPMYIDRYLIYALPAYYLLLSRSASHLFRRHLLGQIVTLILVLGFAATTNLDPPKKQHTAEVVSRIRQLKANNTLVLYTQRDLLPAIAYHYNLDYFAAIADGKEYAMTDSLLHSASIFHAEDPLIMDRINSRHYHSILLYKVRNTGLDSGDLPGKGYILQGKEDFGDGHLLEIYTLKNDADLRAAPGKH